MAADWVDSTGLWRLARLVKLREVALAFVIGPMISFVLSHSRAGAAMFGPLPDSLSNWRLDLMAYGLAYIVALAIVAATAKITAKRRRAALALRRIAQKTRAAERASESEQEVRARFAALAPDEKQLLSIFLAYGVRCLREHLLVEAVANGAEITLQMRRNIEATLVRMQARRILRRGEYDSDHIYCQDEVFDTVSRVPDSVGSDAPPRLQWHELAKRR